MIGGVFLCYLQYYYFGQAPKFSFTVTTINTIHNTCGYILKLISNIAPYRRCPSGVVFKCQANACIESYCHFKRLMRSDNFHVNAYGSIFKMNDRGLWISETHYHDNVCIQ